MHRFALTLLIACGSGCDSGELWNRDGSTPPPPDAGTPCVPSSETESACSGGVDEDCDGQRDCADSDCEAMSCAEGGFTCGSGGCILPGVLPDLPAFTNVRTTVSGSSVEIEFDPIDGARDYRVYAFPSASDVTAEADGHLTVRNATYRCAGNRQALRALWIDDAEPEGSSGTRIVVQNVDVGGYVRTLPEATLGYVWPTRGEGRVPVYAMSDPDPESDLHPVCYHQRWYESRGKRYVTSESERSSLIADGWRDDGVAFYAQASAGSETTSIFVAESERMRFYFAEGPEADMRTDRETAFEVLRAPAEGALALMRVHYDNRCGRSHDELVAGQARFERAYRQGSNTPAFRLHWSGLSAETTLVIEALDELCPWRDASIAPGTAPANTDRAAWITVDDAREASPTREVFVNGQGDAANAPRPVARSYVTVSPRPAPELDWSYGWTADDSFGALQPEECLALASPACDASEAARATCNADCVDSDWARSDRAVIEFNSVRAPWYGMREQLGELWVAIADLGAGTKFRIFPTTQGQMREDSFLYATMLVDSFTTARRYPQIIIADANIPYPVAQNMFSGNVMIAQSFVDWPTEFMFEVCDHAAWEVNNQCGNEGYPDGRWVYDASNPDETQPIRLRPVPDAYELTSGLDQSVRFEIYASTRRVYMFLDGHPYSCMEMPSAGVPVGPVNIAFGDVLYHSGAEDTHSDFVRTTDKGVSIRHFANLGFRSGVPEPGWDHERLPCQPASYLGL
jgi:hypothetical protein